MQAAHKCKGCRKDTSKGELTQFNGLCQRCWGSVSVEQELEHWQLYALRQPQWCQARNPRSGRPCWLETKAKVAECYKEDCVKLKV